MKEYYYGHPYPVKAKLQGTVYMLPKGFRVYIKQSPSFAGQVGVIDHRGNDCDFRIVNGQPCLISTGGAWDIFKDKEAVQVIGGRMVTPQYNRI